MKEVTKLTLRGVEVLGVFIQNVEWIGGDQYHTEYVQMWYIQNRLVNLDVYETEEHDEYFLDEETGEAVGIHEDHSLVVLKEEIIADYVIIPEYDELFNNYRDNEYED